MSLLLTKQIAELFIMILLGYILVKSNLLTKQDSKVLSTVALYIVTPCVIIHAFQVQHSQDVKNGLILNVIKLRNDGFEGNIKNVLLFFLENLNFFVGI